MKQVIKNLLTILLLFAIVWSIYVASFPEPSPEMVILKELDNVDDKTLFDEKVLELVGVLSSDIPYMVDEITQRDAIFYSEDRYLVFENTIIQEVDESVDLRELSDLMKENNHIDYCEGIQSPYKEFGEIGVPVKNIYRDSENTILFEYAVSKDDCDIQ
jgi:hypothetical protein